MKLDRNINPDGKGKYALIKLREKPFVVDFGDTPDSDFFVIRLKDKYAAPALLAYSLAAREDGDIEWADEVFRLAEKAANHPGKRKPD
jgi:hypothetical protein